MNIHESPIDYIKNLVDNQINVNIIEFVKELNKIKFKIDISFIDEFIQLVNKDECCIHHSILQKYGISKLKGGTSHVRDMLNQYNFVENKDYELTNVRELRPQGGTSNKKEYYLHPRAFKKCLMRSKNTNIYADYYLLLEECIKFFNDYQIELNKKYIIKLKSKIVSKNNKISSLEEKLDTIIKSNEETKIMNEKLLKSNEETKIMNKKLLQSNEESKIKLDETSNEVKKLLKINKKLDKHNHIITDKLDEVHEDLRDTNHKLDYTCKKLDIAVEKRVPDTNNKNKLEDLILLKSINRRVSYRYYAIRAQTDYANTKVKNMISTDQPLSSRYKIIYNITNVANSVNVWNRLKENLENKVEYCGNKLNLISISESTFIDMLKEVYDKRKEVGITDDSNSEEYSDQE
jgi:hypothetical protein